MLNTITYYHGGTDCIFYYAKGQKVIFEISHADVTVHLKTKLKPFLLLYRISFFIINSFFFLFNRAFKYF